MYYLYRTGVFALIPPSRLKQVEETRHLDVIQVQNLGNWESCLILTSSGKLYIYISPLLSENERLLLLSIIPPHDRQSENLVQFKKEGFRRIQCHQKVGLGEDLNYITLYSEDAMMDFLTFDTNKYDPIPEVLQGCKKRHQSHETLNYLLGSAFLEEDSALIWRYNGSAVSFPHVKDFHLVSDDELIYLTNDGTLSSIRYLSEKEVICYEVENFVVKNGVMDNYQTIDILVAMRDGSVMMYNFRGCPSKRHSIKLEDELLKCDNPLSFDSTSNLFSVQTNHGIMVVDRIPSSSQLYLERNVKSARS